MEKSRNMIKNSITVNPSLLFHLLSLHPLNSLFSPKKLPRNHSLYSPPNLSLFIFSLLIFFFTFLGISLLIFVPISQNSPPCSPISSLSPIPSTSFPALSPLFLSSLSSIVSLSDTDVMAPLPVHAVNGNNNVSEEEREFWKQPDGDGYKPCLDFSIEYRKGSVRISKEKRRFLVVVASGGLYQQRNQIVNAVVIARILEAALVLPSDLG